MLPLRPAIRPDIAEAAINRLELLTGKQPQRPVQRWKSRRIDRRHSVVFRLTDSTTKSTIFYKVFRTRENEPVHSVDALRNRLARAQTLTDRLLAETVGTAISPAPVLAAEPSQRTLVTLGVEGREIDNRLYWPSPTGKPSPSEQARHIGEACALIERVGSGDSVPFDLNRLTSQLDRRLRRPDISSRDAEMLRELIIQLATDRLAEVGAIYVHGDLSSSNLLVANNGISLIDFSWLSRFRGFDLGLLSYRLHAMRGLRGKWGDRLRAELVTGYEKAVGTSIDNHSLHLVNLILLVRGVNSRSPTIRSDSLAALARLSEKTRSGRVPTPADDGERFSWWWQHSH